MTTFPTPTFGGAPPDPAYVRFESGLNTLFTNIGASDPIRWHAHHGKWYGYPLGKWNIIEVPVPATDPGSTIDPEYDYSTLPPRLRLKMSSYGLSDLFKRVRVVESKNRQMYGPLVWNPVTGEWRKVSEVAGAPPPPPPPPPPRSPCVRLLDEVNRLVADKKITLEEGSRRREEILRMCV